MLLLILCLDNNADLTVSGNARETQRYIVKVGKCAENQVRKVKIKANRVFLTIMSKNNMVNKFKKSFTTMLLLAVTIIAFAQQSKYVTANELNVREGAGKEFVSLGKVYKGDVVTVLSEDDNWAKISFNNGTAYISTQYLSEVKETLQETTSTKKSTGKAWIFFACIGVLIIGIGAIVYQKFCLEKFSYDIFNYTALICLTIPLGVLLFVILSGDSDFFGLPKVFFSIILLSLTLVVLYLFNFKKTNWYIAIFNTIIQSGAVFVFVIFFIGKFILKLFSGARSNESLQNEPMKNTSKQKYYCKCCGRQFNSLMELTSNHCHNSPTKRHKIYEGAIQSKYYCKCCGSQSNSLMELTSNHCHNSPTKKHQPYEGSSKSKYSCKYCGSEFNSIMALTSVFCMKSPTKRHSPAR